jgi:hypothetical protein
MRFLMIVMLFLGSLSAYSQRFGSFVYDRQEQEKLPIIAEVVFKDANVEGKDVIFSVMKKTENGKVTYNIGFNVYENTFYYDKGYIEIYDYDLYQDESKYYVIVYYYDVQLYYENRSDREGNDYKLPVYNKEIHNTYFEVNKYRAK